MSFLKLYSGEKPAQNGKDLFAEVGERGVVDEIAKPERDHEREEWVAGHAERDGQEII